MSFSKQLSDGDLGVRVALPSRLELVEEQADSVQLVDPELEAIWFFLFFPDLHLDLREECRDELRQGLEWPARAMFNDVHRRTATPEDGEPRTADASWSPMVDVEFLSIPRQARAVRTVHRMVYRPGSEAIMGHLLVPLSGGLFEARVLTHNTGPTGVRESALLLLRQKEAGAGLEELGDFPPQHYYDDESHDPCFVDHPLSRLRAAQRMLLDDWRLEAISSAQQPPTGRVELDDPKCSFVPPPRFSDGPQGIKRVTFCGTDGVQTLFVDRLADVADLEAAARAHATDLHESEQVRNIALHLSTTELEPEHVMVTASVDGDGHNGPLRNTLAYFRAAGSLWCISLTATVGVPVGLVEAELEAVARSFEAAPLRKRWLGLF